MADNLTSQVRNIAQVATAVAQRRPLAEDHRRRARRDPRAEERRSTRWSTSSRAFADEVTRVAREVGTEGRLGGQAQVEGVSGTWRGLTESVNFMASNADRAGAQHRRGDDRRRERRPLEEGHGRRARRDRRAEEHDQHDGRPALARSPTRSPASRARSAPRASSAARREVKGVCGTWKDLTDNVNTLAGNLTDQVRNIAHVTTAVANGDLTQKITVDARGEIARAQGHDQHDGRPALGVRRRGHPRRPRGRHRRASSAARREVEGVSGTWKDLTENVNGMAVEPHRPGAQHRPGHDRRRERRPLAEDHRRRPRRGPRAEGDTSTRWSTSCARSPPR